MAALLKKVTFFEELCARIGFDEMRGVFMWFAVVFGGLNLDFGELRGVNWKGFGFDGGGNKRAIFLGLIFSYVGFI